MQDLSRHITENLETLAKKYSQSLQNIPSYQGFNSQERLDIASDDLARIATCLELADIADFIELTNRKAQERLEQGFSAKPLMQALTSIEETLSPLVTDVETTKFLWKMISEARNTVSLQIAQDTFNKQREFLWRVIDALPSFIFVRDREGKFVLANQAIAQAYSTTVKHIIGKTDADFNPNQDEVKHILRDDLEVMDSLQEKFISEQIITGADGNLHWMQVIKRPLIDDDGIARRVLGVATDISQRKQLEQEIQTSLERRIRQVEISTEIAQGIVTATSLDEIYNHVVTSVKEHFNYYHVQIFRHDPQRDAMVVIESYGEVGKKLIAAEYSLPYEQGVVGMAAASGEPVLAPDVTTTPGWVPHPDLPQTRGELAVPIKWQNEVLGILDVQSNQAGALTEEDQVVLLGLAGQIASAIVQARLFKQTQSALDETQTLYDLSRSLSEQYNVTDVLQTVVDSIAEALPANRATAITFDLEKKRVTNFVKSGPGSDQAVLVSFDELWNGLSGWVLREQTAVLSPKGKADPRESPRVQNRRQEVKSGSIIVAPLLYRGDVLGTMTVINRPDEPDFTQRDVDFMMTFVHQAVAAVENIRLFEQTQNALKQVEATHQLYLQDQWSKFVPERAAPFYERSQDGITHRKETAPTFDETSIPQGETNMEPRTESGAEVVVPLILRGTTIGTLGLERPQGDQAWTNEDLTLIESVAEQLAIAIESARLLDETQRRAVREHLVTQITTKIRATTDPQAMLQTAVSELREALQAQRAQVVIQPEGDPKGFPQDSSQQ